MARAAAAEPVTHGVDDVPAGWWEGRPWRLIQTNLREIDMRDIDAARYVESLRSFEATVAMIMCGRPHSRRIVGNSTCASHVYKDTGTNVESRPP